MQFITQFMQELMRDQDEMKSKQPETSMFPQYIYAMLEN
jgi:hypothetical protein